MKCNFISSSNNIGFFLNFCREGYLRLSSSEFSLNNIGDKFIHLTNNAVQKYSDNYGQFENGNQMSFADFERYCSENSLNIDVRGKIVPRIKELIQISMESVKRNINPNDRKYCFEIFGYDFMIDIEGNVWLIEVNTNPCIEESSPILQQLIPRMLGNKTISFNNPLDDAMKLTIDVVFPPPKKPVNNAPTTINNNNVKIQQANNIAKQGSQVVNEQENEQGAVKQDAKALPTEEDEGQKNPEKKEKKEGEKEDSDSTVSSKEVEEEAPKGLQPFKVDGYQDNENMWYLLMKISISFLGNISVL